jgi:hypothetical protein
MSEDNPYRPPVAPIGTEEPRGRRPLGPVLAGLVAIVLATFLLGGTGLIASLLGVGSWWVYKFWPRPAAPDSPEARAYLQQLEGWPSQGNAAAGSDPTDQAERLEDVFGNLRL